MGDPPEAPFGAERPLTEDRLLVPLWIKFPGGAFGGTEVPGPVASTDVAATLARALGIPMPDELAGTDLYRLAAGAGPILARGLLATLGPEYSMRFGPWLLRGTSPEDAVLVRARYRPGVCARRARSKSARRRVAVAGDLRGAAPRSHPRERRRCHGGAGAARQRYGRRPAGLGRLTPGGSRDASSARTKSSHPS